MTHVVVTYRSAGIVEMCRSHHLFVGAVHPHLFLAFLSSALNHEASSVPLAADKFAGIEMTIVEGNDAQAVRKHG